MFIITSNTKGVTLTTLHDQLIWKWSPSGTYSAVIALLLDHP
jgi:hypothetical protein